MNVDLKLSVLKPIHATWLVETSQYNFFTSAQWRVHGLKGWEKAGIKGILTGGGYITDNVPLPIKCKLCITQKREIKVIQNAKFSQNRKI